jgi:protein involved in polysaccharide export with SLBB domain
LVLIIHKWPFKKHLIVFLIAFFIQLPFFSLKAHAGSNEENTTDQDSVSQNNAASNLPFKPGDGVEVSSFPDSLEIVNKVYPITELGYIDLPIYGKVKITDMTKVQLENFFKEKYREYLRFPNIQVKPVIRVSVLGGVPTPGFYYFDPDLSLWELINKTGGTIDEDGLEDMKWERDRGAVKKNLIPYLQSGISIKNIGIQSGDQIWVKTPGKPGLIEKLSKFFPIFTFLTGVFTFYYTYQILIQNRNAGRVGTR